MLELEEKTERLQRLMHAENLGGILLNGQHNFAWLSCGRSNGIDGTRENGAATLLVTRSGKRYVIANNIEMPRILSEEISSDDFEAIQISWQDEKDGGVFKVARSIVGSEQIATDLSMFNEARAIDHLLPWCRFELTQPELTRFRMLGRDAGEAVGDALWKIGPGQAENKIAALVKDELAAREIFPVVTLVGADERIEKYRHPVPTANVWRKSLLIVVCVRRYGLIASLSRMLYAGDLPEDLLQRTEACAAVNAALYDATVPGRTSADLYNVAANAYSAQGFADEIGKHHQGGACGYRTRDWVAHPRGGDVIVPNQAFAWNPSITGTKTEETAILVDGKLEIITATDGFPIISSFVNGREYLSPGILSLSKGATA